MQTPIFHKQTRRACGQIVVVEGKLRPIAADGYRAGCGAIVSVDYDPIEQRDGQEERIQLVVAVRTASRYAQEQVDFGGRQ